MKAVSPSVTTPTGTGGFRFHEIDWQKALAVQPSKEGELCDVNGGHTITDQSSLKPSPSVAIEKGPIEIGLGEGYSKQLFRLC